MINRDYASARGAGLSLRAIIAFAALVGIVAMHGLTMNHNTAMATTTADATTVTVHTTSHTMTPAESIPESRSTTGPTSSGATHIAAVTAVTSHLVAPHSMGDMASACVAFLTGLLLMASGPTLIRTIRQSDVFHPLTTLRWMPALADRLKPDLVQLSVLRT